MPRASGIAGAGTRAKSRMTSHELESAADGGLAGGLAASGSLEPYEGTLEPGGVRPVLSPLDAEAPMEKEEQGSVS